MKPGRFLFGLLASLFIAQPLLADETGPLQVYVLAGQSNMQGHAHVRTLAHLEMDGETSSLLEPIQAEDGSPKIQDRVWISYLSNGGEKKGRLSTGFGADENKLGPELTFGIGICESKSNPILIIKTAWGGKSLHTDFRPPSAGSYEFTPEQLQQFQKQGKDPTEERTRKETATGHYYRLMVDHIQQVLQNIPAVYPAYETQQGYQLAGFVWFQGWNDMVDRGCYPHRDMPGGYDKYSDLLAHFIRDVRRDLSAPELPFVIGVLGVGGPVSQYAPDQQRYATVHQNFRDAMAAPAALPEFEGNVAVVRTENYWDSQLGALRARESRVRQQARQLLAKKKLERTELAAMQEELLRQEFSEQERDILLKGVSNAEYHYLGSAKIMAQIGAGFAEAMSQLDASH